MNPNDSSLNCKPGEVLSTFPPMSSGTVSGHPEGPEVPLAMQALTDHVVACEESLEALEARLVSVLKVNEVACEMIVDDSGIAAPLAYDIDLISRRAAGMARRLRVLVESTQL